MIKKILDRSLFFFAKKYNNIDYVSTAGLDKWNENLEDKFKATFFTLGNTDKKSDSMFTVAINSGTAKPFVMSNGLFSQTITLLFKINLTVKKTYVLSANYSIQENMDGLMPEFIHYLTKEFTNSSITYSWLSNIDDTAVQENGNLEVTYRVNITVYGEND